MDDWQLFMNPNVVWELSNKTNKVVFIYTTGNDAGGNERYWKGNEEAAINSVQFCINQSGLNGIRDKVQLNNHVLHRWTSGNAVCYFLRLPDGNLSGEGFANQDYQSLQKLYRGDISFIKTLDQSTVYHGWGEFVNIIQRIIDFEGDGISFIKINHPEVNKTINPGDHSDHIATGLAVKAVPKYERYHNFSYIGYSLMNYPADLWGEELFWKIGLFFVYDKTLYDMTKYSNLKQNPHTFMEFCFRSAKFH
ncbi:hypothetical protein A4R27_24175 [Priestia endophytica]|nr:hypothetical protein A4R27_24175 [Priestia endophytica]